MSQDSIQHLASGHYYDSHFRLEATKILPGEYYVTSKRAVLVTLLGSCVAACIRDPESGIGGMNHFMLPVDGSVSKGEASARYGDSAMQILIGHLLRLGACRQRLEAKVFGGGAVLDGLAYGNVGARNAGFVLDYLREQGIPVLAHDLLGICPRRVYYFPHSGRVLVKRLQRTRHAPLCSGENEYAADLFSKGAIGYEPEISPEQAD